MGTLAALLLVAALLAGGLGLFIDALQFLLVIAAVLVVASMFTGWNHRRTTRAGPL